MPWSYLSFSAFALVALLATLRHVRRLGLSVVGNLSAALVIGLVVALGNLSIRDADRQEHERLLSTLEALAPVYAEEFEQLGHARLGGQVGENDELYALLIETQLRWLGSNDRIADVYTFRRLEDGTVVLMVDSETDYDRNGRFEGEREARTEPGEVYDADDVTPQLLAAFDGAAAFDLEPVEDRWGTWISAYCPLRDQSGRVEAVLGVDFPAEQWVSSLQRARATRAAMSLALLGTMLAFVLVLAELSGRLLRARDDRHRLLDSVAVAKASDRAKSLFLANMSHEMRTPLNGVLGTLELLEDSALDPGQREHLQTMRASAQCLLELVSNTLDLGKIESGKMTLERREFDLSALVEHVALITRGAIAGRPVEVHVQIEEGLGPRIAGDEMRLRQILLNLAGNAAKFTPAGRIDVCARSERESGRPAQLVLEVRDTGIGIPADKLGTIFEKFSQADTSTTRNYGGSGLGLTIARELAQLMQGSIEVHSKVGVGSRFALRLPLDLAAAPSEPKPALSSAPVPLEPRQLPVGLRVLLVEDNATNYRVVQAMLQRLGCAVTRAENGAVAVERVRESSFDAILMDCQMPVMDGFEAAARIRLEPHGAQVPIIALTANALVEQRELCLTAGMTDYLTKPVKREQLAQHLMLALERNGQDATGDAPKLTCRL